MITSLDYNGSKFYFRDDSSGDTFVIRENLGKKNVYDSMVPLLGSDIVLDIGAHIGSFAVVASTKALEVVSYEPDPDNFKILEMNTAKLLNVHIFNSAVVGANDGGKTQFYLSPNGALSSIFVKRGRGPISVDSEAISHVYSTVQPSYIKCDIEGGEYSLFVRPRVPESVRAIVMEVHFIGDYEPHPMYPALVSSLQNQGFKIQEAKKHIRTQIISAERV